ncbi:IS1595 family transposase [Helicobacter pylori]|uniref:IS1595 family transposase n=1 Tax=Helicobacter pylori TaxID=210 RepID=UPI00165AB152|nr:IS1595 family transposase [Helicobacter pylori]WQZ72437.1 IS1595 family transposase [Helicobacter pylori]
MPSNANELEIIKQLFNSLTEADKKAFLKTIKNKNKENLKTPIQKEIKECPHCKSTSFVKNGKKDNRQRFSCKACSKTFTYTNNTILFSTKKDIKVWKRFIHCMVEKYSLKKTAQICNIDITTAFYWRHKILDTLQDIQNGVKLDGIVEADETYFPLSFKGHHRNFKLPRLSKKRGTQAAKRGLSKEQVCVTSGVNLNGKSIAKVSNLGKLKIKDLEKVLTNKVSKGSIFVTDSFKAYLKLANDMELSHIRIPKKRYRLGSFNIQTINSYHSHLKDMIKHKFKGVATKYLDNYLVYHNFVNFAKESYKETILLEHIQNSEYVSKSLEISHESAILLLAV